MEGRRDQGGREGREEGEGGERSGLQLLHLVPELTQELVAHLATRHHLLARTALAGAAQHAITACATSKGDDTGRRTSGPSNNMPLLSHEWGQGRHAP